MGKQKMRVREVVPADFNESALIPNDSIRLTKTTYEELHFRPEGKQGKEESPSLEEK